MSKIDSLNSQIFRNVDNTTTSNTGGQSQAGSNIQSTELMPQVNHSDSSREVFLARNTFNTAEHLQWRVINQPLNRNSDFDIYNEQDGDTPLIPSSPVLLSVQTAEENQPSTPTIESAISEAVEAYQNVPITLPNGTTVTFTVPYNTNRATDPNTGLPTGEAGGPLRGKGSPEQIQQIIQGIITNDSDMFLSASGNPQGNAGENITRENFERLRTEWETFARDNNFDTASPAQQSELIEQFCRENRIGVDCSGMVYNVLDQADESLNGSGMTIGTASGTTIDGMTNSTPVDIDSVRPGDTIRLNDGQHIAIVTAVERRDDGTVTIHFADSSEQEWLGNGTEEGLAPAGVRTGSFTLSPNGVMTDFSLDSLPGEINGDYNGDSVVNENDVDEYGYGYLNTTREMFETAFDGGDLPIHRVNSVFTETVN